jgi:hypothetical protein
MHAAVSNIFINFIVSNPSAANNPPGKWIAKAIRCHGNLLIRRRALKLHSRVGL